LNDGLVAYYPFNGNANDASGNGHHGTVHGATLTEDRLRNQNSAYNFDGVDDYIISRNINIPTDSFSYILWFKATSNLISSGKRQDLILFMV
jgi:hypothetical protein